MHSRVCVQVLLFLKSSCCVVLPQGYQGGQGGFGQQTVVTTQTYGQQQPMGYGQQQMQMQARARGHKPAPTLRGRRR